MFSFLLWPFRRALMTTQQRCRIWSYGSKSNIASAALIASQLWVTWLHDTVNNCQSFCLRDVTLRLSYVWSMFPTTACLSTLFWFPLNFVRSDVDLHCLLDLQWFQSCTDALRLLTSLFDPHGCVLHVLGSWCWTRKLTSDIAVPQVILCQCRCRYPLCGEHQSPCVKWPNDQKRAS
jgi:hypothetical protein